MRPASPVAALLLAALPVATAAAAGVGASGAGASGAGASGVGTLRICASDLTNFDDTPSLALPAGLIFTEWGPGEGDLRALRLDPDYPPARARGQAAVVLDGAVTLTGAAPCADAPARALLSTAHGWHVATVRPGNAAFLASDTLGPDGPRALGAEARRLYDILTMNVLAARPADPIGAAETVR